MEYSQAPNPVLSSTFFICFNLRPKPAREPYLHVSGEETEAEREVFQRVPQFAILRRGFELKR